MAQAAAAAEKDDSAVWMWRLLMPPLIRHLTSDDVTNQIMFPLHKSVLLPSFTLLSVNFCYRLMNDCINCSSLLFFLVNYRVSSFTSIRWTWKYSFCKMCLVREQEEIAVVSDRKPAGNEKFSLKFWGRVAVSCNRLCENTLWSGKLDFKLFQFPA